MAKNRFIDYWESYWMPHYGNIFYYLSRYDDILSR